MPLASKTTSNDIADKVARKYGFEPLEFFEAQKGYRNESHPIRLSSGQIINAIFYKNEPDIIRTIKIANEVSNFLSVNGFPARITIDPRLVQAQSGKTEKFISIYNYLPGETISWEAYTQKHIKLLGRTLSDVHASLKKFDASNLSDVTGVYSQIVQRMKRYFALPGVQQALESKLNLRVRPEKLYYFENVLEEAKKLNNKQALHMDFVRSNILFDDTPGILEISGILDFEKTAYGHPTFDIARTLAFLLVDCKYKPADKVRKYFLYSGYKKRGKADLPNVKIKTPSGQSNLLEALVDLYLVYDFYKFLRHNPYEYLPKNEHFVRTRDILIQRNVSLVAKILREV